MINILEIDEENLAKGIIEKHFKEFPELTSDFESPDIQSVNSNDIGIEVTIAIPRSETEILYKFGEHFDKIENKNDTEKENLTNSFISRCNSRKDNPGWTAFKDCEGNLTLGILCDNVNKYKVFQINEIAQSLIKKLIKLQTYKRFKNNAVFIYTELEENEIKYFEYFYNILTNIQNDFKDNSEKIKIFDIIFICFIDKQENNILYFYDMNNKNKSKRIILEEYR